MKLELSAQRLHKDLAPLLTHIIDKPIDDIYNNLFFQVIDRTAIIVYSGNGKTFCRVMLSDTTVHYVKGMLVDFLLPAKVLDMMIRSLKLGDEVSVEVNEGTVRVSHSNSGMSASYDYSFNAKDKDKFYKVDLPTEAYGLSFSEPQVKFILENTLPFASIYYSDHGVDGLYINPLSGDMVDLVAFDGLNMAVVSANISNGLLAGKMIPSILLERIQPFITENEKAKCSFIFTPDHVYYKSNSFVASTQLVLHFNLEYQTMWFAHPGLLMVGVDKEALLESIKRICNISQDGSITVSATEGHLALSCDGYNGVASEIHSVKYTGFDVSLKVKADCFLHSLIHNGLDFYKIGFYGAHKPICIHNAEDALKVLLAPVQFEGVPDIDIPDISTKSHKRYKARLLKINNNQHQLNLL